MYHACQVDFFNGLLAGSRLGLFIPEGARAATVEIVTEGESDLLAALSIGVGAIGVPGAGACASELVEFLASSNVAAPCIVGDRDRAGVDGANQLADALLASNTPCRVLTPPEPHSDLRDWLASGLSADELRRNIDAVPMRFPDGWLHGFAMIPHAFARRGALRTLSGAATKLALTLASFQNGSGTVHPSRETLTDLTGLSIGTLDRAKRELHQAGLLRWRRGGTGKANCYRFTFGPIQARSPKTKKESSSD